MWERDINNLIDTPDEFTSGNDTIDGFTISSSSRPFHGSQFHAQCNTWPTDSDFSWSQVQVIGFAFIQNKMCLNFSLIFPTGIKQ